MKTTTIKIEGIRCTKYNVAGTMWIMEEGLGGWMEGTEKRSRARRCEDSILGLMLIESTCDLDT